MKLNGVFVASLSRYFYVTHRLSDDLVSKPREKKDSSRKIQKELPVCDLDLKLEAYCNICKFHI